MRSVSDRWWRQHGYSRSGLVSPMTQRLQNSLMRTLFKARTHASAECGSIFHIRFVILFLVASLRDCVWLRLQIVRSDHTARTHGADACRLPRLCGHCASAGGARRQQGNHGFGSIHVCFCWEDSGGRFECRVGYTRALEYCSAEFYVLSANHGCVLGCSKAWHGGVIHFCMYPIRRPQIGYTALLLAVSNGCTESVRVLLSHGADKNAQTHVRLLLICFHLLFTLLVFISVFLVYVHASVTC